MERGQPEVEHWLLHGTTDVLLDTNGRLLEHITCRSCGYDLISLEKGQQCPECGSPVAISIRGDLLAYSRPEWTADIGQHIRISGLLLMAFPIVLAILVGLAIAASSTVSGTLPSLILLPWGYCVLRATLREPVALETTRLEQAIRISTAVLGLIILLSFAALGAGFKLPGRAIFAIAAPAFLTSLSLYLYWLSKLILRVPSNDLCDTLHRRVCAVLVLTVLITLLVLLQNAMGVFFFAFFIFAPAWMFYVLRAGYSCVQAGEIILCESRLARQHWIEREALLDKERRFREARHTPPPLPTDDVPTAPSAYNAPAPLA